MPEYYRGLSEKQETLLEQCRQNWMVGVLSDANTAIWADGNNKIHFYVEQLCADPDPALEIEAIAATGNYYIGDAFRQPDDYIPRFYEEDTYKINENIDALYKLYDGKIMLFHPYYSFSGTKGRWYKNLVLAGLKDMPDGYEYPQYQIIPSLSLSPDEFDKAIHGKSSFKLPEYSIETNDPPEGILCGDYLYLLKDADSNAPFMRGSGGYEWVCVNPGNLVKIPWKKAKKASERVIHASENICFMEADMISELLISGESSEMEKQQASSSIQAEEKKEGAAAENEETEFLRNLQQLAMQEGLQYQFDDLVNFHTCIKTTPLTILAGMSGTGKSRLAMTYAENLGLSEENGNLLFLPVAPSFMEPSDVLGYYNAMNQSYVPSDTGLVQFLKHACDHPDEMHMAIFDEMNLSQVEYWFSPFISILEKNEENRILKLYDSSSPCLNRNQFPPSLKLGRNVLFAGTVNIDDTTRKFSDRLLDRIFVISLQKISFTSFYEQYVESRNQNEEAIIPSRPMLYEAFHSWQHGTERNYMEAFGEHTDYLQFFDELDQLIRKYIPDGGISHRQMKNIGNYLQNIPADQNGKLLDDKKALDLILCQTVLTRIRGTESQLLNLIGTVDPQKKELEQSELKQLFSSWYSISGFDHAMNVLRQKAEELRINGYTD